MSYYCYLLHSKNLDQFYIGSTTISPEERLDKHLMGYYGRKKFTVRTNDWELYYDILCKTKRQALSIEAHIKRMKSKTYNTNLIRYPEITEKLLKRYQ